jgi:hypothetical protein
VNANANDPFDDTPTYEFRWDVAVPGTERRYGQKFMKQWKRVLQAQKMAPLVSAKLAPREARFQLCVADEAPPGEVNACEAEVTDALAHLRWHGGTAPDEHIHAEGADRARPGSFQGVRVWVTFARQDVETVLGKKARI